MISIHMHIVFAGLEREREMERDVTVAHASGELLPDHFRCRSTAWVFCYEYQNDISCFPVV